MKRNGNEGVVHFRAAGPGWQSRINEVLAKHVRSGSK
ncbi:MAG: hypothetical protein EPN45_20775 [Rhizobiaceae bacterium]|nr:MAG: hypothetical protein EPN45_20775 [Rhizobiaceae bacterium]